MNWLERAVDPGREYHKPLVDLEEDVFLHIGATRAKTSKFWVQLALASVIAAGGVIGNSTPAVIGAMIIAPLATPIYGLALAAVIGDRRALRSSLVLLVSGITVNILIGVLIGLVTVNRMPIDVNPQIIGRTAPTILDLAVAVATGVAGSFALARRDVADILAGVAIAISLVPVLAVVGITLGAGDVSLALGAFLLFLANAAAILVAGAIVFKAAGYAREAGTATSAPGGAPASPSSSCSSSCSSRWPRRPARSCSMSATPGTPRPSRGSGSRARTGSSRPWTSRATSSSSR